MSRKRVLVTIQKLPYDKDHKIGHFCSEAIIPLINEETRVKINLEDPNIHFTILYDMHVINNMTTYIENREHRYGVYIYIRDNGHLHILSNSNNLFVNLGHQEDISFLSTSNAISLRLVNGSVKGGLYCNS